MLSGFIYFIKNRGEQQVVRALRKKEKNPKAWAWKPHTWGFFVLKFLPFQFHHLTFLLILLL